MATLPDKPLVWLHGEIKTPPFSPEARLEAGFFLRKLQQGDILGLPHSRPMPTIGRSCHELRIEDQDQTWRIIYRIDSDAIVIAEIFKKKTKKTPPAVINTSQERLNGGNRGQIFTFESIEYCLDRWGVKSAINLYGEIGLGAIWQAASTNGYCATTAAHLSVRQPLR